MTLGLFCHLQNQNNLKTLYLKLSIQINVFFFSFFSHAFLTQRAIGVLSRILAASSLAVEEAVKGGVVKKMIKFLKVT